MKNRKKLVAVVAGILAAIMILSLILSVIPTASAASSSEIKKQIDEMKKEQQELQQQKQELLDDYKENENEIYRIVEEKNLIEQEIAILYSQIDLINGQITAYNLLIADKQDELEQAQALYDELKEKNKDRIRAMEEDDSLNYWSVIFESSSFFDLLDRLNMIEEINAADRRKLQEMSEAAQLVADAQQELELEREELETTRAELDETQQELESKRTEANDLLTELLKKCAEIEGLQEELEQMESDLLDELAQAEKDLENARYQEYLAWLATSETTTVPTTAPTTAPTTTPGNSDNTTATTATTAATTATSDGGGSSGTYWMIPCSYIYVSSAFGNREQPVAGASTYHQGVDLAAPAMTPIYASRAGTVSVASSSISAGNYVKINHGDGYSSIYMHMTYYVVKSGQTVTQGQLIGYVGSTGYSSGNHLHFGISYNGTYVNPASYLNLY